MTTPTITPDLRRWIISLARQGLAHEQLRRVMMVGGWSEAAANDVLCEALAQEVRTLSPAPAPIPLPSPDLTDYPIEIDAGDRRVRVVVSMTKPCITLFADFLSGEECDMLIAEATPRLERSTVVSMSARGEHHPARTSNGMFFRPGETELIRTIEARIAHVLRWPVEKGEGLQLLQYGPGAEYKPHFDYFGPEKPTSERHLRRGGQRVGTLLMYLSDVPKGGGTIFPDAGGLMVPARRGHAVFFNYPLAHPVSQSLHGGSPVIEGMKWVATKWLREDVFT
jgi:prolyl 4-hydroxylase